MEDTKSIYHTCTVRIPNRIVAQMDTKIRDGHAINRADYIRRAVFNTLR